jgi:hypothetical protein
LDVAQEKIKNYQNPTDEFLPLTIEVFGCLHKQVDAFLHDCANVMWNFKMPKGPPLYVLINFLYQKNSMTL